MVTEFGILLRQYRERGRWSLNRLAHEVGIDPSYVNRIQAGDRNPPHRHIVEALARILELSLPERNRFLLAAGLAPASLVEVGAWPEAVQAVTDVLTCPGMTVAEQDAFSQVVCAIAEQWRRGAYSPLPLSPTRHARDTNGQVVVP